MRAVSLPDQQGDLQYSLPDAVRPTKVKICPGLECSGDSSVNNISRFFLRSIVQPKSAGEQCMRKDEKSVTRPKIMTQWVKVMNPLSHYDSMG